MNLLEEYQKQQLWRNWDQYLQHIPLRESDHVVDLGCSVGAVARRLSKHVKWVTGIDLNRDFIEFCEQRREPNQSFICESFEKVNYRAIKPITGVWSSFSLSYLENPTDFLSRLHEFLEPGSWIALVDVSCFLSGNMPPDSKHLDYVREFEANSWKSGKYDFDFGSKMQTELEKSGFTTVYSDDDISDPELNFTGPASSEILDNWNARLQRMQGLRIRFPDTHTEICSEILSYMGSAQRTKRNNVRFVVGVRD